MTSVAIVFANNGPYHLARLAAFQEASQKLNWRITSIELARKSEYDWKAKREDFSGKVISIITDRPVEKVSNLELIHKTLEALRIENPDVLAIAGYSNPCFFSILLWGILKQKPVILFSASKEDDAPRSFIRERIKSWIVNRYSAALVGGKPQKRYLINLGMAQSGIFTGYNVVGNSVFHPEKIRKLPSPINNSYFFAVNRFVPKKNLTNLISAYALYRQRQNSETWDLVISGDGPLRSQIEQQIIDLNLQKFVHLPGFLQQEELLPYFAHAGCFVHASTQEQWGLVINEAMAAGLPVLVSNRCGCVEDLLLEGVNGYGFDPENQTDLTNLMLKISANDTEIKKMGQASLKHIQNFSPSYFAEGLKQAVNYVLNA